MPRRYTLVSDLAAEAREDPATAQRIAANPAEVLSELAAPPPPLQRDAWIYRIVVLALGLAVLIALVGALVLSFHEGQEIPDVVTAIGSGALGAIGGLLAPSPAAR